MTVAVPAHRRDVPETATVAKMISERLPPGLKLTAEVKEMILDACNEFVQCVASEANEISTKENKSTILPEHVVGALESLDFASYVQTVSAAMLEMKEEGKAERADKGAVCKAEQRGEPEKGITGLPPRSATRVETTLVVMTTVGDEG